MIGTMKVESEVPFGHAVHAWLELHRTHLDKSAPHGEMERRYLAWETVRKQLNPYFQQGTGFEGYLIGRCETPEAALDAVLAISQNILDAIARLYRFEYGFKARLMRTLTRERSDPDAIRIWSSYLGMELGRLRAQIIPIPAAQHFQYQTYRLTSALPQIRYIELPDDVIQTYSIATDSRTAPYKLTITAQSLNPSQQDAWLIAENIGEFGHPLVRTLLDHE